MGRSSARALPTGSAALLSIGQVLARLTTEFPDVTPSKLRFLEEQGLVSPARTDSGYRKFSGSDVERLRMILALQRDHYLPLKVIRGYLDDIDAGREPALPAGVGGPSASLLGPATRLTREGLAAESGATPALVQEAIAAGLVRGGDVFGDEAVTTLKALVDLGRSGIEPRHLRPLRVAVEREMSLIESVVASSARRGEASGSAGAAENAVGLATQLGTIRGAMVRSALSRIARS
ncbi:MULTISPECIES: MerR family transcriptional regulator [unclassified Rathayibacter]|uniref:transcriptional regulator FtsR n=1 Tax=unclassified Rathayibacter TaxID=2609250 RepID=UPI000CE85E3A|nr:MULTISPECIES: MerR family transcriptional regulator [unclassified Rathayibacter]PPF57647.1 MerR family transcriptional regulator [Rathayibacter sp. AY1C2]PPF74339.1 MerR family transcriptional regulator [Rathayibacter sp. AY1E6]PPG07268.1 MerR family transcriptional regulator [Rathayibacter sp. AY2B1]PPG71546.1 MerR family transcriptional regulator [Rathayibacter sp. AY1F4]PPH19003.1 MerR family transcriptional regulator [Rathayibacter sp. AY1C4]